MALDRVGAEIYLDNSQYISAVGQTVRANERLDTSLKQTNTTIEQMGIKFDSGFRGAEKFGNLVDVSTGRIRKGLELVHEKIDQTTNKYQRLAESGRRPSRQRPPRDGPGIVRGAARPRG